VLHALVAEHPFEQFGLLTAAVGGDDDGDRLTDSLLGSPAIETLGADVPAADDQVAILAQDRVVATTPRSPPGVAAAPRPRGAR
jgi:hypothetical protein